MLLLENDPAVERLLRKHPKAIAHLWSQKNRSLLGMLFGAGASNDLEFPGWATLVERIKEHPAIDGKDLRGTGKHDPLPTATQVLFHHFHMKEFPKLRRDVRTDFDAERLLLFEWLKIVHDCLYTSSTDRDRKIESGDCLYAHYLDVIRSSRITITYNFDDSIERLLLLKRRREDREEGRGFETVVDPRIPFRLPAGNILHVNGFLPSNLLEGPIGEITLNEVHFADQIIEAKTGAQSTLIHYLTKQTFLLIGVSLQDEMLRHLLRQNAQQNPGHYHYRIERLDKSKSYSADYEALRDSHFSTYNLVTLFLDDEEIRGLGRILSARPDQLRHLSEQKKVCQFFPHYLVGVPGAGKTTIFRHLASLMTQDEWIDERLPLLSKPWPDLTAGEQIEVDRWITDQIRLKNLQLADKAREPGIGVYIIDRCAMDAITFTPPDKWEEKARSISTAIADEGAERKVVPGHIIFLEGEPAELLIRAKSRGRQTTATPEEVEWQQDALKMVYYGKGRGVQGVSLIDCRDSTISDVVRRIAHKILLEDYVPCDIDARLKKYGQGGLPKPTNLPPGYKRKRRGK